MKDTKHFIILCLGCAVVAALVKELWAVFALCFIWGLIMGWIGDE